MGKGRKGKNSEGYITEEEYQRLEAEGHYAHSIGEMPGYSPVQHRVNGDVGSLIRASLAKYIPLAAIVAAITPMLPLDKAKDDKPNSPPAPAMDYQMAKQAPDNQSLANMKPDTQISEVSLSRIKEISNLPNL